jgi:hypothetical protein
VKEKERNRRRAHTRSVRVPLTYDATNAASYGATVYRTIASNHQCDCSSPRAYQYDPKASSQLPAPPPYRTLFRAFLSGAEH